MDKPLKHIAKVVSQQLFVDAFSTEPWNIHCLLYAYQYKCILYSSVCQAHGVGCDVQQQVVARRSGLHHPNGGISCARASMWATKGSPSGAPSYSRTRKLFLGITLWERLH